MRLRFTRRSVVAATLAVVTVVSMAACRVEQGAAVFVGDSRITEQQVDQVVDSVPARIRTRLHYLGRITGDQLPAITAGKLRGYVVDALATIELGKQVAADTGKEPGNGTAKGIEAFWTSEIIGMGASSKFVTLLDEAESYREVLFAGSTPAKPTSADIDSIARQFTRARGHKADAGQRKEWKRELSSTNGPKLLGNLHQVEKYISQYDVTANPRYGESYITVARDYATMSPAIVASIPS
ncbi:MAG TPA: hypothetical protein VE172_20855 [Stackebrandtia sp.]|jgi:hypothetical protein|uniref:hypothetical protein n=1 Tax=Stackebrandtia sp. TaxID=2023065 RepID=UPI002D7248C6|nr:hypothetical protein [Stackebrandtia sp.]HZE41258.1 hypothetical protein [Stackebrandtia sp.]